MNKKLNKYTIDDFLKLKPVIYEYCLNLSMKKTSTSWYRDLESADDLYQDVFIYVTENYFNKPISNELMTYGKFVQLMKNCTYWAFYKNNINPKYSKNIIKNNIDYYQDSGLSEWIFDHKHYENPKIFNNFEDNPDYQYYIKDLKFSERMAIKYYLEGFTQTEVAKKFNKTQPYVRNILKKVINNINNEKTVTSITLNPSRIKKDIVFVPNDIEFLKQKVKNFDKIFENQNLIKLYSLYLQGFDRKFISKTLDKSINQINVEIFRINQKIKKVNE